MANTGAKLPGTVTTADGGYDVTWTNPNNIKLADGNNAVATFTTEQTSDWLIATNFGFAIPSNATIFGLIITAFGSDDFVFDAMNYQAQVESFLWDGATIISNQRNPILSGLVNTDGGSSDLWGAILTPTIVNSSSFGLKMRVQTGGFQSFGDARIDYVKLDIYYSGSNNLMLMGVG